MILIAYVIVNVLTTIFDLFATTVSIISGIIALILGIVGFTKLNNLFKKLGNKMDSALFPLYAWWGIIVVAAIIITAFTLLIPLVLAVGVIAIVGEILILIGIGIKLLNNAKKIGQTGFAPPVQPAYQPTYQPISQPQQVQPQQAQPQKQATTPAFCPQCGAKLEPGVKFCANCGASI